MAFYKIARVLFKPFPVRGFAKNRRLDEEFLESKPDFSLDTTEREMQKAIDWLEGQLLYLKVGRSDPRTYEEIVIPSTHTSLKILGRAIALNSNEIQFRVFDSENTDIIVEALKASNLQLTARKESSSDVLIKIPRPSAEFKAKLLKQAKELAEDAKNAVQKQRHYALQTLKGYKDFSKDDSKRFHNEIQGLTDQQIEKIVNLVKAKEAQLEES